MFALRKIITDWRQEISGLRATIDEDLEEGKGLDDFSEGYARGKEVCANHLEGTLDAMQESMACSAECHGQTFHGRWYLFRRLFAASLAALVFGSVNLHFSSGQDKDNT